MGIFPFLACQSVKYVLIQDKQESLSVLPTEHGKSLALMGPDSRVIFSAILVVSKVL